VIARRRNWLWWLSCRRRKDAKKASKEAIVNAKALSFRGRTFRFFLPEKAMPVRKDRARKATARALRALSARGLGYRRWKVKNNKIFGFLTALIILFLLFSQTALALSLSNDEKTMLELVNEERLSRNLSLLKIDWGMTELATEHSEEMVDLNYFDHTSPISGDLLERIEGKGLNDWKVAGENLAAAPTSKMAFRALMESTKHRENILNPEFTHVGLGITSSKLYGKMFTQEFVGKEEPAVVANRKVLPLASKVKISFELLAPAAISLEIYNLRGELVASVIEKEFREAGPVEALWKEKIKSNADENSQKYEYRVTFESSVGNGSASTVEKMSPSLIEVERENFSLLLFFQNVLENLLTSLFS